MLFSVSRILQCTAVLSTACAYAVSGGSVAVNREVQFELDPAASAFPSLELSEATDKISISVDIGGSKAPHQLLFLLLDESGLDHAVFASYSNGEASADFFVHKLPAALKAADLIHVSVVAASANADSEQGTYAKIAEFVPTGAVHGAVKYEKAPRLGALPEIHHVFKLDESTVNSVIPLAFSAVAAFLLVVLLGAWGVQLKGELFTATNGSVWKAALLSVLVYFEHAFLLYYLGASIFATLFKAAALAGPFLFFSLRSLSALRKARA